MPSKFDEDVRPQPFSLQVKDPPGYWMHEKSGRLAAAVKAYLEGRELTVDETHLLRAYCVQWIASSAWDQNPHARDAERATLAALRAAAWEIRSRAQLETWLTAAEDAAMDPL